MDKHTWIEVFEAAGIDAKQRDAWHAAFERRAPEGHREFLVWLGLSKDEIEHIRNDAAAGR